MLHFALKNILVEKLQAGFPCTIRYETDSGLYEKPFKLGRNSDDLKTLSQVNLINYFTNERETINFSDITIFSIPNIDNLDSAIEHADDLAEKYKAASTKFDFINGDIFYSLVFNVDVIENTPVLRPSEGDINVLSFLNLIRSADIEDYRRVVRGEYPVLQRLRVAWKQLILKKYENVLQSLDQEALATDDPAIKQEIESIKDIVKTIPSDIDAELATKETYEEIKSYWPTLLLPRSTVLDVSKS